jgi:hypothetical protein
MEATADGTTGSETANGLARSSCPCLSGTALACRDGAG